MTSETSNLTETERAALRRINADINAQSIVALMKLGMTREQACDRLGIPDPAREFLEAFTVIGDAIQSVWKPFLNGFRELGNTLHDLVLRR